MSILNKFKKKKFIYIIPIVFAAFSINYVIAELSQGQSGYNSTARTFDGGIPASVGQIDNCGGVSLTHEVTDGNKGAGSADLSFSKSGSGFGCIITIQLDITPSTDAGVPIGNDWIDIDVTFFYKIISISGGITAHWGEVRLHDQACASNGAEIVKVEKDLDPNDDGTFDLVVTVTFVSHNPQGSSTLADLDPTINHCVEIDLEIVATGGGGQSFQIFIDDILIEFSTETKAEINFALQQSFNFG